MKTIQEINEYLKFLKESGVVIELFLVFNAGILTIKRASLADAITRKVIDELGEETLLRQFRNIESIREYDPSEEPGKHCVFNLGRAEVAEFNRLEALLSSAPEVTAEDAYPESFIIKFSKGNKTIFATRKKHSVNIFKNKTVLWKENGQLSEFNNERKIFIIDHDIDSIFIEDTFYIFKRSGFENSFQFHKELERVAMENAASLMNTHNLFEIAPEQNISEYLQDSRCVAKLRKLDMDLIGEKATIGKLQEMASKFSRTINFDSNKQKFVPQDKKEFKSLLSLLSDDLFESELSGNKYEVNSKQKL